MCLRVHGYNGILAHLWITYSGFVVITLPQATLYIHPPNVQQSSNLWIMHTLITSDDVGCLNLLWGYQSSGTAKLWRTFGHALIALTGNVFMTATKSLDEFTEVVTSYVRFSEGYFVPSCTRVSHNNDKPRFTEKLWQVRLQVEEAFSRGAMGRFKESKYRFSKVGKKLKQN